ncbi:hypothetical protein C4Q28_14850 [Pseudomonas sp. SWI6]|uniref:Uncharacterized protein n=1 Tax=Pseudomonas taiwanensis TaxID=470150 RepID=A0ABR6VE56_9PSED|nr:MULTISPECIES: hypothetical protein [Pseudomonas]AGZ35171.1 hypothetical protein PVLB_11915 [Pseudomonas sp. VLB120]AVD83356.1 hypothetical protein C4Q28_14850 [Pseudomonas sp. SWI6]AVD90552.1 hypothetical protein C4Q26_26880 [Pseudomonas sp. SWI44]MBC3478757.1 hypothetical protein [Pseudomonas taiwanensis]MDT8921264.1 hypothetical protein [Pseudomonas taiwanensis]
MTPFNVCALATALHSEAPIAVLDLVQRRLAEMVGPHYTVVLCGSGEGGGISHYHLAIQHGRSGVSLEHSGVVEPGFIEQLLTLGQRTRAMIESPAFERMLSDDPARPLTWISDDA